MSAKHAPIKIEGGWLDQHHIRRARKDHRCDYWLGRCNGGKCAKPIKSGQLYVEGEPNENAGGYAFDRYCFECAGPEARAALAAYEASK